MNECIQMQTVYYMNYAHQVCMQFNGGMFEYAYHAIKWSF